LEKESKKMEKITKIKDRRHLTAAGHLRRLSTAAMTFLLCTAPAFAGVEDVGQNLGNWLSQQAFWVAIGIISVVAIGFIIKRAWIPCLIFVVLGGIILFIISNPSRLQAIGESLFGIVFN
jgi:hypothetical protein